MSTNKEDRGGEFSVSGVVDARRELVWQAFSEPEHLAAFWGGPGITVPVESVAMDVRPGGSFELTMVAPRRHRVPKPRRVRRDRQARPDRVNRTR